MKLWLGGSSPCYTSEAGGPLLTSNDAARHIRGTSAPFFFLFCSDARFNVQTDEPLLGLYPCVDAGKKGEEEGKNLGNPAGFCCCVSMLQSVDN